MKQTIIMVLLVLLVAGGAGYYLYSRNKSQQAPVTSMIQSETPAVMTQQGTTQNNPGAPVATVPTAKPMLSPIPAVSQITLFITSPADKSTVAVASAVVKGHTVAGADIFVNDTEVTADAQGNFTAQVSLDEGDNVITVTANDSNGNYAEKDITVTYSPAQ